MVTVFTRTLSLLWVMFAVAESSSNGSAPQRTLANVPLRPEVRWRIKKTIAGENLLCDKDLAAAAASATATPVQLGWRSRTALQVVGGDKLLCGMHDCQMWLFDTGDGRELLSSAGWRMILRPGAVFGLSDVIVLSHLSSSDAVEQRFRYLGGHYHLIRSSIVKSDLLWTGTHKAR